MPDAATRFAALATYTATNLAAAVTATTTKKG